MGGLAGLSLFFGILLSGLFLRHDNLPLALLFAAMAAAPVVFVVFDAVRNRYRARGHRRRTADPHTRRAARLAGAAALALGAGSGIATLVWALRVFAAPGARAAGWAASVLFVVVTAALSVALVVAAVRVLCLSGRGAAAVLRITYLLVLVAALAIARSIGDLDSRWPYVAGGAAAAALGTGVVVLQKRALRALGGPDRRR